MSIRYLPQRPEGKNGIMPSVASDRVLPLKEANRHQIQNKSIAQNTRDAMKLKDNTLTAAPLNSSTKKEADFLFENFDNVVNVQFDEKFGFLSGNKGKKNQNVSPEIQQGLYSAFENIQKTTPNSQQRQGLIKLIPCNLEQKQHQPQNLNQDNQKSTQVQKQQRMHNLSAFIDLAADRECSSQMENRGELPKGDSLKALNSNNNNKVAEKNINNNKYEELKQWEQSQLSNKELYSYLHKNRDAFKENKSHEEGKQKSGQDCQSRLRTETVNNNRQQSKGNSPNLKYEEGILSRRNRVQTENYDYSKLPVDNLSVAFNSFAVSKFDVQDFIGENKNEKSEINGQMKATGGAAGDHSFKYIQSCQSIRQQLNQKLKANLEKISFGDQQSKKTQNPQPVSSCYPLQEQLHNDLKSFKQAYIKGKALDLDKNTSKLISMIPITFNDVDRNQEKKSERAQEAQKEDQYLKYPSIQTNPRGSQPNTNSNKTIEMPSKINNRCLTYENFFSNPTNPQNFSTQPSTQQINNPNKKLTTEDMKRNSLNSFYQNPPQVVKRQRISTFTDGSNAFGGGFGGGAAGVRPQEKYYVPDPQLVDHHRQREMHSNSLLGPHQPGNQVGARQNQTEIAHGSGYINSNKVFSSIMPMPQSVNPYLNMHPPQVHNYYVPSAPPAPGVSAAVVGVGSIRNQMVPRNRIYSMNEINKENIPENRGIDMEKGYQNLRQRIETIQHHIQEAQDDLQARRPTVGNSIKSSFAEGKIIDQRNFKDNKQSPFGFMDNYNPIKPNCFNSFKEHPQFEQYIH